MRAITQSRFGPPEAVSERDAPVPMASEVLVAVRAVGPNPVEAAIRSGAFPLLGPPPFVLGWDLSGTVIEVVPGVHRFVVGDEVYGMPFFPRPARTYAEFVAAPSRQLARKPRTLDHIHAAALPLAGLTAWQALTEVAKVRSGDRVLIHGGGGGVGHIAIQIAKHLGAFVVSAVSNLKSNFVRELGADQVIDYRRVDFTDVVSELDVLVDLVGGDYGTRSIEVLRHGGLLLTAVERTNTDLSKRTVASGKRFAGITVEPDGPGLERLAKLVEEGRLRVHVDSTFPLAAAAQAHARLEAGVRGKIVLTL